MRPTAATAPLPWIDWGKAIASQLIVWHHLAHYGPLPVALRQHLPTVTDWLDQRALWAVQVFLVISGYLAARSLWPSPGRPRLLARDWPGRVAQRWTRLAPTYLLALLAALLCAAVARVGMQDPDTPAAPTLTQLAANLLMLQDIVGQPALSAGVWYVAIDLQLFALLGALAVLAPRGKSATGLALLVGAVAASLLYFNLRPDGDMWAPFFFGAYGLGVLAAWGQDGRPRATLLLAGLLGLALAMDWRGRVLLAGATALVLLWQPGRQALATSALNPLMQWLARISYAVFLLHYPISLLVATAVMRWAPNSDAARLGGLVVAWLLSLAAGELAWRWLEQRRPWSEIIRIRSFNNLRQGQHLK